MGWDHAGHLPLRRNDNYWGGKTAIFEINSVYYQDTQTPYDDWKAGKGDIACPPGVDFPEASKLAGFHRIPAVAVDYLQPNWHIPPFDNLDARIAFDAAIDRAQLAATISHGAVNSTYHYIVPGLPGYNPALTASWGASGEAALHADLDTAHRHMQAYVAAPGSPCRGAITSCPPVEYNYSVRSPTALALGQMLVQMWQTALPGYPVSIRTFTGGLINNTPNCQLAATNWVMDYPADEDWYDSLLEAHAGQNQGGIDVQATDQLVALANVTEDQQSAEALYQRAEQLYVNQVAWIVLDQPYDSYLVSRRVVGHQENAAGLIPTRAQLGMYETT
jgi:ABC-type oligopeptide transport system substrate-binding subunit